MYVHIGLPFETVKSKFEPECFDDVLHLCRENATDKYGHSTCLTFQYVFQEYIVVCTRQICCKY